MKGDLLIFEVQTVTHPAVSFGSQEGPVSFPSSIQMGKSVDRCIIFCGSLSGTVCPRLLVLFIYSSYVDGILSQKSASILV